MYPYIPSYGTENECKTNPVAFPPQHQDQQPGLEFNMVPQPIYENPDYQGSSKLANKVAIISGGDSGIGRAVAIAYAKEGAEIAIVYLNEHRDAEETRNRVEQLGRTCLLIAADLRQEELCNNVVQQTIDKFKHLDILVNNQAIMIPQKSLLDITAEQLDNTFRTNIYSYFYMSRAALPHLSRGSSIINTTSVTAYEGHVELIDYSATKGAIVSFTRSLALSLSSSGVRVNAVAPGPVWTPLVPAGFSAEQVKKFGLNTPLKRAGQPFELAPAFVFLAADDSGFISGQVIHVNGGVMVNS
ncbi:MAG: NAD(P)-dependent oxidoreductase [Firmicutes bacterium HGW-Firmicutes-15]|nr:MAG: NAD(P)-dependent oxidoreductase [Firmicutes bacterium HGW-Firmicutes-15]